MTFTPETATDVYRGGTYRVYIADDQWWTRSELTHMIDMIHVQSIHDARAVAWQTVRSIWDPQDEHWYLTVDVYPTTV